MPIPANRARFTLSVAELATALQVLKFQGQESLSELFRFELEVVANRPDLDLDDLLERDVLLRIEGDTPRLVHGTICDVAQSVTTRRLTHYHLTLVPRLHWLSLRHNVRIFRNLNTPDIVRKLLQEAGFDPSFFRFELTRDYPLRPYCVQYNESELAFIERLLADEGIHYHFEHHENRHVLVMADHGQVFRPLQPANLSFNTTGGMAGSASVMRFHRQQAAAIETMHLNDYDALRPNRSLASNARSGESAELNAYQWPGGYQSAGEGSKRAQDRLHSARLEQQQASGTSLHTHLVPGGVFRLTDHPRKSDNREYLLRQVTHEGFQPQVLEELAGDEGSRYQADFIALPADQVFRPPQRHARPIAHTQTAVVVGPDAEPIYTNEHGELQVRFHWDRDGAHTCWLRLAQSWAGNHWGSLVLPRVGQEVIVSFLEGDPDRPLITGCLYHKLHQPPYPLPEHASRSLLRSQSLAGNDGHELMLEDKAGQERIAVHSARDLELHVIRDRRASIDRHERSHSQGDSIETVAGSQHQTVSGERRTKISGQDSLNVGTAWHVKAGQNLHHQAGQALHYKAGQRLVIEAGTAIHLKAGAGSIVLDATGVHFNGPMIGLNGGGGGGAASAASPKAPTNATRLTAPGSGKAAASTAAIAPPSPASLGFLSLNQLRKGRAENAAFAQRCPCGDC